MMLTGEKFCTYAANILGRDVRIPDITKRRSSSRQIEPSDNVRKNKPPRTTTHRDVDGREVLHVLREHVREHRPRGEQFLRRGEHGVAVAAPGREVVGDHVVGRRVVDWGEALGDGVEGDQLQEARAGGLGRVERELDAGHLWGGMIERTESAEGRKERE